MIGLQSNNNKPRVVTQSVTLKVITVYLHFIKNNLTWVTISTLFTNNFLFSWRVNTNFDKYFYFTSFLIIILQVLSTICTVMKWRHKWKYKHTLCFWITHILRLTVDYLIIIYCKSHLKDLLDVHLTDRLISIRETVPNLWFYSSMVR